LPTTRHRCNLNVWTQRAQSRRDGRRSLVTPKRVLIPCLHDQNKSGFLEAGFYPANQSNLKVFKKLWLAGKKRPSKKATFVLIMQTGY